MVSSTFERICELVKSGEIRISEHGYEEMSQENISARDVVAGVPAGIVVEDYPNYAKGSCVLVLERDHDGMALHVVWGFQRILIRRRSLSPCIGLTRVFGPTTI